MNGNNPDREAAAEFLDFLYSDFEGFACLVVYDGGWNQVFYQWPQRREAMLEVAMEAASWADVYIGMLLYSEGLRALATALPGHVVWADVDHQLDPGQRAKIRGFKSRVIGSGTPGNTHVYIDVGHRTDVATLESMNKGLQEQLGGDAKWDASTVLRLPGTFNHKYSDPRPVETIFRADD